MKRLLSVAAFVAFSVVPAFAQVPMPSNTSTLSWDYPASATTLSLAQLNHFDVQWTGPTDVWRLVPNKALTTNLPVLSAGSYEARVRACATTDTSRCVVSDPLAYTVQAPAPTSPAKPTSLRIAAVASPSGTGVTYYETNFNTSNIAPLSIFLDEQGSCAQSTDFKNAGATQSLRCQIVNDGSAAVLARFGVNGLPANPTLDKDFYVQYRFVIGAGSASVGIGPYPFEEAYPMWKLHKATYGEVGGNVNGWSMITNDRRPMPNNGLFTEPELYNNSLPGGNPSFTAGAHPYFVENTVYEIVRYYRRNSAQGCGYYGLWVNGQQRVHTSCLPYLGTTVGGQPLWLQDGAVYAQNTVGTYSVYNLYMKAADYPLGGVTF